MEAFPLISLLSPAPILLISQHNYSMAPKGLPSHWKAQGLWTVMFLLSTSHRTRTVRPINSCSLALNDAGLHTPSFPNARQSPATPPCAGLLLFPRTSPVGHVSHSPNDRDDRSGELWTWIFFRPVVRDTENFLSIVSPIPGNAPTA